MMVDLSNLPTGLAKTLSGFSSLSSDVNSAIDKIRHNTLTNVKAKSKSPLISKLLKPHIPKLKELGWSEEEINGDSRDPSNMSLSQTIRPDCVILEINEESVIFKTITGAILKHVRQPAKRIQRR